MSVFSLKNPTLLDAVRAECSPGTIPLVELLTETNEILQDMTFIKGNLPTGHKTTVRTGLPTAAWRKLNYGIPPSKSVTAQVVDTTGMLEAYSEIDKSLADLNGNTGLFRLSEDRAFLEAMNIEMAETLFYGNEKTDDAKFTGLSVRFDKAGTDPKKAGFNVISGGSTVDKVNTSIWFVVWGPTTCHGIYPRDSRAGFQHTDLGQVTITDPRGGRYEAYRAHYKWDLGLTVRDWRSVVRIGSLDTSAFGTETEPDLISLLIKGYNRLGSLRNLGRAAIYCNETVGTWLDIQAINKSNVWLSVDDFGGKASKSLSFRGIPIRRCDAIKDIEELV